MIKQWFKTKTGSAIMVAASLVLAGTIASASAARTDAQLVGDNGYTKDQCKDDGWRDFKDENGGQLFKNQGQCVAYFVSGQPHGEEPVGNENSFLQVIFGLIIGLFAWFGSLFQGLGGLFWNVL
jgi:hypothetical protein